MAVTAAINDLVSKDLVKERASQVMSLPPQDEMVLESLFDVLGENWQDADFNVDKFAKAMAMSSSQLYRKTVELCDMSPNALIREFKLEKAKELMKKRRYNISQITFDTGFASPSYFTKCFKTRYGLLPMAYIDLLH